MDRTPRLCDVCGAQDTFPRHVTSVDEGGTPSQEFLAALPDGTSALAIQELLDPSTVVRHIDCCAQAGCPNCTEVFEASGKKTGQKLLDYIVGT